MGNNVYIVSAQRTPIGRFQGALKSVPAAQLGAIAIKAALQSAKVAPEQISEVIMGQVLTAGVGQAPARQAAIAAGIPHHVPALTIGKVCGSGLKAVMLGVQSILVGDSSIVTAGGQENMSAAPYLLKEARDGFRMGHKEVVDSMMLDGLFDPYNKLAMGNCAEACVKKFALTRESQDTFAEGSYLKARAAIAEKAFESEISSVSVTVGKSNVTVAEDEEPAASDLAKLKSLRPAFDKEGTITAGNASKINDGAAAVVLASEAAVQQHNLKPLAKIVSWATHAQDPMWFTTAPVEACRKALSKAKLTSRDIDLFEINEAFAAVAMVAMRELEIPAEKVNVHGGAVALGHPIGASGARILATLVYALGRHKKRYGLATLCIGGGEAVAIIVERV